MISVLFCGEFLHVCYKKIQNIKKKTWEVDGFEVFFAIFLKN
jgi:hypothetical protein